MAAESYDVIIIGAGMSGITAAAKIAESGRSVLVLEGRDRIGGRVWSTDLGDFGGSWIHGHKDNPMHQIAQENGIEIIKTDYENYKIYTPKGPAPDSLDEKLYDIWHEIAAAKDEKVSKLEDSEANVKTLHTILEECIADHKLSEADAMLAWYGAAVIIENEFATDASGLSGAYYDDEDEKSGDDYQFPGGYVQIINAVMRKHSFPILLGKSVSKISYGDSAGVHIHTRNGDTFHAKSCIVSVPLGVLKHSVELPPGESPAATIVFNPPLPERLMDPIRRLNMGTLNKYIMQFSESVWPVEYDLFQYLEDAPPFVFPEIYNWSSLKPNTLVAFATGSNARNLSDMPDDVVCDMLFKQMQLMWPGIKKPLRFERTRWDKDTFSMGSYSAVPPGATRACREAFYEPIGVTDSNPNGGLWFAGEHTCSEYPSTVRGAYLSGLRAAKDLLSALAK